jgi:sulfatase modifying factor 1
MGQVGDMAEIYQSQRNSIDGAEMIWVPQGYFLMGSDGYGGPENPQRRVHLDSYCIYKYPVTVAQYARFCQETGHAMPEKPGWGWRADHPVVNVSWEDATNYCNWAHVCLPSEAEWEKAARGDDGRQFPWGDEWDMERCRCSREVWGDAPKTAPVTSYPGDVSPYEIRHMAGNVYEWCQDCYGEDYYDNAPDRNPAGPDEGERRVVRGGCWGRLLKVSFRCAGRRWCRPIAWYDYLGFRCVFRPGSKVLKT